MLLGALHASSEAGKEHATKATITKLHNIIMERYESYMTRRMPISTTGMPPQVAAEYRLWVLRDLMRMEMPDAFSDVQGRSAYPDTSAVDRPDNIPLELDAVTIQSFSWPGMPERTGNPAFVVNGDHWVVGIMPRFTDPPGTPPTYCNVQRKITTPALARLYWQSLNSGTTPSPDNSPAQCLYMVVSMGSPEALEHFNQNEIGTVGGRPVFIDGWGNPIMWLRWAPGFSSCQDLGFTGPSEIQTGIAQAYQLKDDSGNLLFNPDGTPMMSGEDHDPFDSRKVDADAFLLVPLIYSAGSDGVYDIDLVAGYMFAGNPFADMTLGQPMVGGRQYDNITNHLNE